MSWELRAIRESLSNSPGALAYPKDVAAVVRHPDGLMQECLDLSIESNELAAIPGR